MRRAIPQTVTEMTDVQCYSCGWKGMLGEAKKSIYIDNRPGMLIPTSQGGNGTRWRCPLCKELIFYTTNVRGNIIAPAGHQYRSMV